MFYNICIDACPVSCLTCAKAARNDNAYAYLVLKNFIGCGFYAQECPVNAIANDSAERGGGVT